MSKGFSVADLRISQDFNTSNLVSKVRLSIPIKKKPDKTNFIRVHADPSYELATFALEFGEENEIYLLAPNLRGECPNELIRICLTLAVTTRNEAFIMYSKMVGPEDKRNQWLDSKRLAIEIAKTKWVRIFSNMDTKAYDAIVAKGEMPDPEWPTESFEELVQLAFQDKYISDRKHPALKKLRGEL